MSENVRGPIIDQMLTNTRGYCREILPTEQAVQPAHKNLLTTHVRSPRGIVSFTPNILPIFKDDLMISKMSSKYISMFFRAHLREWREERNGQTRNGV